MLHARGSVFSILRVAFVALWTASATAPHMPPYDWPVDGVITREYEQPADAYSRGHRGIDIRPVGSEVHAPADGVVAFVGRVVDRSVITIDHGSGVVTTLEPVTALVDVGDDVVAGDVVGTLATGGHTSDGELHIGIRIDGTYVNPRVLLGGVQRAILLPCCAPIAPTA